MQFESKNGPMELNRQNVSYAVKTLFYRIGNLTKVLFNTIPAEHKGHLYRSLFREEICKDNYITALFLQLIPANQTVSVPINFQNTVVWIGPNLVSDLKEALKKLPEFNEYQSLVAGQTVSYDSMAYAHVLNAIGRRITLLSMNYRNLSFVKYHEVLCTTFNMELFAALDPEIDKIEDFIIENI